MAALCFEPVGAGWLAPVAMALLWASALACLLYLSQLRGRAVAGSLAWIALGLALLVAVSLAAGAALAGVRAFCATRSKALRTRPLIAPPHPG